MTYPYETILSDLSRIRDEFFGNVAAEARFQRNFPLITLYRNDDEAVIKADLPGVQLKDLEIQIEGPELKLSFNRPQTQFPEGAIYHREERAKGKFARTFELPFALDAEKTEAKLENGVLTVKAPLREESKPRKIAVTVK